MSEPLGLGHACFSNLARLAWGLWCGPLLAGRVRSSCVEDLPGGEKNVDITSACDASFSSVGLTLVTPENALCALQSSP